MTYPTDTEMFPAETLMRSRMVRGQPAAVGRIELWRPEGHGELSEARPVAALAGWLEGGHVLD